MIWPFGRRDKKPDPVMEMNGDFVGELATHLAAQIFGDGDLPGRLQFSGSQRDRFIRYSPLFRAVTLISSLCAQMMTNGNLTVRNSMDQKVDNRRTDRVMELLTHSPDGGVTPALNFIEDVMADYLLDGNGLVGPIFASNMMPVALVRYRPHGAYTVINDGPVTYWVQRALSRDGMQYMIPARDMIHIRWPLLQRGFLAEHQRMYFSPAPISLFARQIMTGLLQDAYMEGRFDKAPLSSLMVNYMVDDSKAGGRPLPTPDQTKMIADTLAMTAKQSAVMVGFGAQGSEVSSSPVHEHALEARSKLVEAVAGMYGLPTPLMSLPLGQWTRGVNEQVMKMAWRTGIRPHMDRLLAALKTRLLMPGERFEVDPSEFIRGDASGISEMLTAMQGDAQRNPIASLSELRRMAGLPGEPEGDIVPTIVDKTPEEPNDETEPS